MSISSEKDTNWKRRYHIDADNALMLRQEDVSTSEAERYDETFALVKPFHSHDLSINSPYCLSFTAYNVSSANLVSNQIISPR